MATATKAAEPGIIPAIPPLTIPNKHQNNDSIVNTDQDPLYRSDL